MTTAPSSAGEMGLALAALLILFFPLLQPAILLVVMFALAPVQSGVQAGMSERLAPEPQAQTAQPFTQPKSVRLQAQPKPPDKLLQSLPSVGD